MSKFLIEIVSNPVVKPVEIPSRDRIKQSFKAIPVFWRENPAEISEPFRKLVAVNQIFVVSIQIDSFKEQNIWPVQNNEIVVFGFRAMFH